MKGREDSEMAKRVMITAAADGIGRAIAKAFAAEGAKCISAT